MPIQPGDTSRLLTRLEALPRVKDYPRRRRFAWRPLSNDVAYERDVPRISCERDEAPGSRVGHRCAMSSNEPSGFPLPAWGEEPPGYVRAHGGSPENHVSAWARRSCSRFLAFHHVHGAGSAEHVERTSARTLLVAGAGRFKLKLALPLLFLQPFHVAREHPEPVSLRQRRFVVSTCVLVEHEL